MRYTCDGTDTPPSFRWGAVPPNTAELVLALFGLGRAAPSSRGNVVEAKLLWAVAGLSPKLHAISAGRLPHGAVSARQRYTICPAKGTAGFYLFEIHALSQQLPAAPHFDANTVLQEAQGSTVASGSIISGYKRA